MSKEKYKFFTEQKGVNHIKVFKASGNSYVNYWNFSLNGDSEPIIFEEFYTESRFALVNWDGWIRLYDADIKTTLVDHKLNGRINSRAVFSLDKSKLYVAYQKDSDNYLAMLNLQNYEIETLSLPHIYKENLEIRKDGCLLFYKHDWERIDDKKNYKHFYSVLNPETKKLDQFELQFAPQYSFDLFKPVIDIENNRVIMPLYDDVSNKKNALGEVVFEYRIAFFDLNTFDITHILSVRDFPTNQLRYYENTGEEMAEFFIGSDRNSDYKDMQREFLENLNTIKVVKDGIWLCWRGGIVRKINSDFTLSPLLVTNLMPNCLAAGLFSQGHFHSHLYLADNTNIVLTDGKYYQTTTPNLDVADSQSTIPLTLEVTNLDELYNLTYSEENLKEIKVRDCVHIKVKDLSTNQGIIDALARIETMASDLKAAGIGKIVLFTFSDAKENALQEPEFFAEAARVAPELVQTILEKLMDNNSVKYLYRNEEEAVFCHAVSELAKKGETYLDTIIKYLDAIEDPDYNEFIRENVIQYIEETCSVEVIKKKTKAFSPQLGEWYEYYREEYD
ncbi:hypothetical protein [Flavobacterium fluviatile]|uniref:hypothetical protein n=1 Tax=Flavobacterium fluviatile TaxID=1862387 RepID=UPI0013D1AA15|nr:hypothetical protein [Flavobacterium fluviatile]